MEYLLQIPTYNCNPQIPTDNKDEAANTATLSAAKYHNYLASEVEPEFNQNPVVFMVENSQTLTDNNSDQANTTTLNTQQPDYLISQVVQELNGSPVVLTEQEREDILYDCPVCSEVFLSSAELSTHLEWELQTRKCFVCKICKKIFKHHSGLSRHKKSHKEALREFGTSSITKETCGLSNGKKRNEVQVVNQASQEKGKFSNMLKNIPKMNERIEALKECGTTSMKKEECCEGGLLTSNGEERNEEIINQSAQGKEVLNNMQLNVVRNDKIAEVLTFKDETIVKVASVKDDKIVKVRPSVKASKKAKRKSSKAVKEEEYRCDICQGVFAFASGLSRHKKGHLPKEMQYLCRTCGKSFKQKLCLEGHLYKYDTHDVLGYYECSHCTRNFKYLSLLDHHCQNYHRDIGAEKNLNSVPSSGQKVCKENYHRDTSMVIADSHNNDMEMTVVDINEQFCGSNKLSHADIVTPDKDSNFDQSSSGDIIYDRMYHRDTIIMTADDGHNDDQETTIFNVNGQSCGNGKLSDNDLVTPGDDSNCDQSSCDVVCDKMYHANTNTVIAVDHNNDMKTTVLDVNEESFQQTVFGDETENDQVQTVKDDTIKVRPSVRASKKVKRKSSKAVKEKEYRCDICQGVFAFGSGLSRHKKGHLPKEMQYLCRTCGKSFKQKLCLEGHLYKYDTHDVLGYYECSHCTRNFKYLSLLDHHCQNHHRDRVLAEKNLEQSSGEKVSEENYHRDTSMVIANGHNDDMETTVVDVNEQSCGSNKLSDNDMVIPEKDFNFEQSSSSDVVYNKKYADTCTNTMIADDHNNDMESKVFNVSVQYCDSNKMSDNDMMVTTKQDFDQSSGDVVYQKMSHADNSMVIADHRNDMGMTVFDVKESFQQTIFGDETENDKLQIVKDDKTIKVRPSVKASKKVKRKSSKAVKEEYRCDICQGVFAFRSGLSRHKKGHLPKEMQYLCRTCGKSFKQKLCLEGHLYKYDTHDVLGNYECSHCTRNFKYLSLLDHHCQNHHRDRVLAEKNLEQSSGEKVCEEKYHRDTSMVMVDNHSNATVFNNIIRSFVCKDCGKSFTSKTVLEAHQKSCSGKKDFKCKRCKRCFNQLCDFLTHQKEH